jgi:hypothetical protein
MAMTCLRLHSEMALQTSRALESADHSETGRAIPSKLDSIILPFGNMMWWTVKVVEGCVLLLYRLRNLRSSKFWLFSRSTVRLYQLFTCWSYGSLKGVASVRTPAQPAPVRLHPALRVRLCLLVIPLTGSWNERLRTSTPSARLDLQHPCPPEPNTLVHWRPSASPRFTLSQTT